MIVRKNLNAEYLAAIKHVNDYNFQVNEKGDRLLHSAVKRDDEHVVSELIKLGAEVNIQNAAGSTFLMIT